MISPKVRSKGITKWGDRHCRSSLLESINVGDRSPLLLYSRIDLTIRSYLILMKTSEWVKECKVLSRIVVMMTHFYSLSLMLIGSFTWSNLKKKVDWFVMFLGEHSSKVSRIGWIYGCQSRDYQGHERMVVDKWLKHLMWPLFLPWQGCMPLAMVEK